jgi:hypothetical protein
MDLRQSAATRQINRQVAGKSDLIGISWAVVF